MKYLAYALVGVACAREAPVGDTPGLPGSPGLPADQLFSYSFAYNDKPPEGRFLRVSGILGRNVCQVFKGEKPPKEFWIYSISLPASELGSYPIGPVDDSRAHLEISRVEEGEVKERRVAVSGEVHYKEGPTDETAWAQTTSAAIHVDARFPKTAFTDAYCEGSQSANGAAESTCTCVKSDGSQITCQGVSVDCCYEADGQELVPVVFSARATACAEQCVYSQPELAVYCHDLSR